jgi:hypothetical protein
MSKIDDLCATVARIEQKVDDIKPRLDKHSAQIQEHEVNLNGDKEVEGINEWRRNFYKRHALISALVPSSIVIGWELVKHKLTGKW